MTLTIHFHSPVGRSQHRAEGDDNIGVVNTAELPDSVSGIPWAFQTGSVTTVGQVHQPTARPATHETCERGPDLHPLGLSTTPLAPCHCAGASTWSARSAASMNELTPTSGDKRAFEDPIGSWTSPASHRAPTRVQSTSDVAVPRARLDFNESTGSAGETVSTDGFPASARRMRRPTCRRRLGGSRR